MTDDGGSAGMRARGSEVGAIPIETARAVSGLALLRGIIDGRYPLAPMAHTLGFALVEVEEGRALFTGVPGPRHLNPLGVVHGGYAATLLDSCMGCAVHSTLPAGTAYTPVEFKVTLLRAITAETGVVRAEGRVLHGGRRVAAAEGRLTDAAGRLLARHDELPDHAALSGAHRPHANANLMTDSPAISHTAPETSAARPAIAFIAACTMNPSPIPVAIEKVKGIASAVTTAGM
jgi:uncharacterized protein (TIGR00369 family)